MLRVKHYRTALALCDLRECKVQVALQNKDYVTMSHILNKQVTHVELWLVRLVDLYLALNRRDYTSGLPEVKSYIDKFRGVLLRTREVIKQVQDSQAA